MPNNSLVIFALVAVFAAYLFTLWYVAARRRSARRKAVVIAQLSRRKSEAWDRLRHSSAGAP
jgi:hypothetical protein